MKKLVSVTFVISVILLINACSIDKTKNVENIEYKEIDQLSICTIPDINCDSLIERSQVERFGNYFYRDHHNLIIKCENGVNLTYTNDGYSCGDYYYYREFIPMIDAHVIRCSFYCGEVQVNLLINNYDTTKMFIEKEYHFSPNKTKLFTIYYPFGTTESKVDLYDVKDGWLEKQNSFYSIGSYLTELKWDGEFRITSKENFPNNQFKIISTSSATIEYNDKWEIHGKGQYVPEDIYNANQKEWSQEENDKMVEELKEGLVCDYLMKTKFYDESGTSYLFDCLNGLAVDGDYITEPVKVNFLSDQYLAITTSSWGGTSMLFTYDRVNNNITFSDGTLLTTNKSHKTNVKSSFKNANDVCNYLRYKQFVTEYGSEWELDCSEGLITSGVSASGPLDITVLSSSKARIDAWMPSTGKIMRLTLDIINNTLTDEYGGKMYLKQ